jgi:hypothetical protein
LASAAFLFAAALAVFALRLHSLRTAG